MCLTCRVWDIAVGSGCLLCIVYLFRRAGCHCASCVPHVALAAMGASGAGVLLSGPSTNVSMVVDGVVASNNFGPAGMGGGLSVAVVTSGNVDGLIVTLSNLTLTNNTAGACLCAWTCGCACCEPSCSGHAVRCV